MTTTYYHCPKHLANGGRNSAAGGFFGPLGREGWLLGAVISEGVRGGAERVEGSSIFSSWMVCLENPLVG